MESVRLKKIEEIYHAALEIVPKKRGRFLKQSCGDDIELLREVESLLSFEKSVGDFLEAPPESLAAEMLYSQKKNLVGEIVGHYKILSLLGKGGMGVVYLAEDTNLDRKVAIKFLSGEFVHDSDKLKRFIREAKAASALNHPNILTVYEIGEDNDSYYIAAEFIDGKVLNKHIFKENLPLDLVLDISIQIVSALQTAHNAGIVHRDIKPDNVMIRTDNIVKVLDFGLAKLTEKSGDLDSEAATIAKTTTTPGLIMGTPNYMSPEQARGVGITHQTDIFSFGIVLYEMLSGALPFQGESAMDTIGAILHKEPIPLIELLPQVPRDVEYIVNKALVKNTDERYQNTKDLLTDLRRVKQRLDFEEVGRSFSPEDSNADLDGQETQIFDSSDFAQIKDVPPNNLSREIPNLIGREAETAEILDLLRESETRLLTITGIGGTGKTRLADAVSHLSLAEFTDGVYFIALAPIDNHELVVPIIAQTLNVREEGGKSLSKSLIEHLSGKKMLIVLDNFEQITQAAPLVGELLAGSQKLKILVTSRVRLNLSFEREFTLQPLTVPTDKKLSANEFGKFPAVELFVKRAKAAKSEFRLTEENAVSIAEICRQLDGLPLAIELAAVRVKLFAPAAILKRLEKSLNLLTGGAKDLPERQQTMRGAIAWSYDLLNEDEKNLLNRLSVFRGGLTLEGAEFVGEGEKGRKGEREKGRKGERETLDRDVAISPSPHLPFSPDLLDLISSLVDNSLLLQSEQADGEPRFRMIVVVREFAFEKLTESGVADEIKHLHATFYNALAEEAEPDLLGVKAAEWMEKLEREHDNFRAALEWALENQPETALRIVGIVYKFWLRRGYSTEGRRWTRTALEKNGKSADAALRAKASLGGGLMSLQQGDFEEANSFTEESLRLSRKIGNKSLICYALTTLGALRVGEGDLTAARNFTEECLALAKEINDKFQISVSFNRLGDMSRQKEDYEAARKYYEEAYVIAKQESINAAIPIFAQNLASAACLLEDYQSARLYNLESLKGCEELGHKTSTGGALSIFGALAAKADETEKAARLFGASQSIYEASNYKLEKADQIFNDRYIKEARTAIGDEAFDAAYAQGRGLNIEEAIALAREGEADFASETHITNEARFDTQGYSTKDALERQTAIIPTVDTTISEIARSQHFLSRFRKRIFAAALIIIFLIAGGFFGYRYLTAKQQIKSIAVMPFVNQTGNADNEYLSDGLTDALINKLSQLPQTKVIARSSTFKYKGKEIEPSEIAKTLGVQAVVTGRITQQGDMLQISVEMIDAAENTQIWGEVYYRKISNVLGVQQDVAQKVSDKLNVQLSGKQEQQIAKQSTYNSQAYQNYLNGVFYRRRNGADNLKKAIEYQNQAVALDPNFALAYAETALNYSVLVEIGAINPADGKPKARAAAEKAVNLDDTLPEAFFALGYIQNQNLEWTEAERAFKRAIELNPNFAGAHTLYANYLSQLGRTDEALAEIKQSQELDPLRVGLIGNEGIILYYARRYTEAIAKMQAGLKPEPENAPARVFLGQALIADRQYKQAITELRTADKDDNESTNALIYLGCAYALSGNRVEAAAILAQLQTTKKYVSPAALAIFYAALGNKEVAFQSIEKAYAERDVNLQFLKVEPGYDPLREDARFNEWLSKVGF